LPAEIIDERLTLLEAKLLFIKLILIQGIK